MKRILKIIITCSVFGLISWNAVAQDKVPSHGEIKLDAGEVVQDTTTSMRQKTIDFVKNFQSQLESMTNGAATAVAPMGDVEDSKTRSVLTGFAAHHLAVAYLRCSVSEGTCPAVLETVFEMDLINSKISGKASCPSMQTFWRAWLENDMEKRQQHQVQIGYLKTTEIYNRDERPKFIKCKDSIGQILTDHPESASDFFKARYANADSPKKSVDTTIKILEALEKSSDAAFDLKR